MSKTVPVKNIMVLKHQLRNTKKDLAAAKAALADLQHEHRQTKDQWLREVAASEKEVERIRASQSEDNERWEETCTRWIDRHNEQKKRAEATTQRERALVSALEKIAGMRGGSVFNTANEMCDIADQALAPAPTSTSAPDPRDAVVTAATEFWMAEGDDPPVRAAAYTKLMQAVAALREPKP